MRLLLVVLIGLVGGAAVATQAQFAGTLRDEMGTLESVFVTYATGGVVIALAMALARGGRLAAAQGIPWYNFTTGLLGLVIIAAIAIGVSRLGLVTGVVAITVGQFLVAAVLAHLGWLGAAQEPIDLARAAGLLLLAAGTYLVVR